MLIISNFLFLPVSTLLSAQSSRRHCKFDWRSARTGSGLGVDFRPSDAKFLPRKKERLPIMPYLAYRMALGISFMASLLVIVALSRAIELL